MRVRYAAAAGIAAIVVATGIFLLVPENRVIGTNTIAPIGPVLPVKGNKHLCQDLSRLPAGAGFVRLRAESDSGRIDGMRVELLDRREPISAGEVSDVPDGLIEVPLRPETRGAGGARICVFNRGREQLELYGEPKKPYPGAPVSEWREVLGVSFLDAQSSSVLSRRGTILDRFRFGHAGAVGTWGLWLAGALAALASILSLVVVLRGGPRG